jgi:hypothetical protein
MALRPRLEEPVLFVQLAASLRAGERPEPEWIAFLQIGSSQEIPANHLETITPGLVGTQHQAGRFESLLDYRQLAL